MKTLILALIALLNGCSNVQLVCPTGDESNAMAIATEYWAGQGHAIMISENSECTIRSRVKEAPIPGETWGSTQIGGHRLYDIGVSELEPSHLIQSEVRFRASKWDKLNQAERIFCAIHELGHIWERGHLDTFPMQAVIPKDVRTQLLAAGIPADLLQEKETEKQ